MFKIIEVDERSGWLFFGGRRTATLLVLRDTQLTGRRVGRDLLGAVQVQSRSITFHEGERVKARLRPKDRAVIGDVFSASNERLLDWLRPEIQNRITRARDAEWASAR